MERKLRPNLQTNQSFEGNEFRDKNGWPVPLSDPSNPLKLVVHSGSRGETKDFRAMSTDGQDKLSLPEGHGSVRGKTFDEATIKIKKTVGNSLS